MESKPKLLVDSLSKDIRARVMLASTYCRNNATHENSENQYLHWKVITAEMITAKKYIRNRYQPVVFKNRNRNQYFKTFKTGSDILKIDGIGTNISRRKYTGSRMIPDLYAKKLNSVTHIYVNLKFT